MGQKRPGPIWAKKEEPMININENFLNLQDSYLFSTVAKKVEEFQKNNPDKILCYQKDVSEYI